MDQILPNIKNAVIGNTGTLISFRLGAKDASWITREFKRGFTEADLIGLPNYYIGIKLMVDGVPSHPFTCKTLPANV